MAVGVVEGEDATVVGAFEGHAGGSYLAEAYAVAPALAFEVEFGRGLGLS